MNLTPEEQANLDAGLTIDGREPIECLHPDEYDWDWYEEDASDPRSNGYITWEE